MPVIFSLKKLYPLLAILCVSYNASGVAGTLQKSSKIVEYQIDIDRSVIATLKRSPTEFDFSDYKIADAKKSWSCKFEIWRQVISNNDRHNLGEGTLTIVNGVVSIHKNFWRTGGMASPEFLSNEANLILSNQGNLVGRMPYFHLFINEGEVALPPTYVTLNQNKLNGNSDSPVGVHTFFVDDWQQGMFIVKSCQSNPSKY